MTNYNIVRTELTKLLEAETVTREDISAAMQMARVSGLDSDRVLYAQIKRQVEANEEKESTTN
ncbi:hypothetical protein [Lysinibacillus pakistanensis]|uniref:Uncharacterized protein n=1 Tax=Lysinibacillus pakistanensis TaxID=759811 RepID=A0AAQ3IRY5_9BACI|nr:hypothetical protein [Lysinibacillus pakistanensis]MDM5233507.1 hypothetical protein [Lysinibacillus pakistanensis]MDM5234245.1 hypothetical protein [Lysinibacillus pakistanensis]WHY44835.1 hypothetical protein QNH22_16105 [Lysinibacillus pakistanensis]WHY48979.1 hypothetical protein QNH22_12370 [Lysinibacillus pakistanensis]WHY49843.1 hypothetical protein QNH24_16075 [Lysinibacillus pakistanensis]